MIHYFYHLDYLESDSTETGTGDKNASSETSQESSPSTLNPEQPSRLSHTEQATSLETSLVTHAKLFALAVRYQVVGLGVLTVEKFASEAQKYWDHEDLPQAIRLIYTTTADEETALRTAAVSVLRMHRDALIFDEAIASLLRDVPRVAYDLLLQDHGHRPIFDCGDFEEHRGKARVVIYGCPRCKRYLSVCSMCLRDGNLPHCDECLRDLL